MTSEDQQELLKWEEQKSTEWNLVVKPCSGLIISLVSVSTTFTHHCITGNTKDTKVQEQNPLTVKKRVLGRTILSNFLCDPNPKAFHAGLQMANSLI